jgi:hypothetical protein
LSSALRSRITATELARVSSWILVETDPVRFSPVPERKRQKTQSELGQRPPPGPGKSTSSRAVKPRHSLPKKDYLSFWEIWRAQRPGDSKTRRPKEKARASPSWCWPFCFPATCARVSRETGLSSVWCGLNRAAYVTLRPCACPARLRVALPSHPRSSVHAPDSP